MSLLCSRWFLVALATALHMPAGAQPGVAARIDATFAPWDTANSPGAVVSVLKDSRIIYQRGYGMAHLEHGVPMDVSTVFMVASVSKQFTAFAVAMLANEGHIELDEPVRRYVPELSKMLEGITVRQLIHHTGGLRDEFGLLSLAGYRMDDIITKNDILALLYRQHSLNFEPGTEYAYSNSGYTLLAEIVERATNVSFRAWTTEHIFAPLEMNDSHFRDDHGEVINNLAQSYTASGEAYRRQTINYSSVGASGLYTTAGDLARWARNFHTQQVGSAETHRTVRQRGILNSGDTLSYAFGQSFGFHRGKTYVGHSGSHRGFRAHLVRFPQETLAVAVLSNLEEFNPSEAALAVAELFIEPQDFTEFTGTYYSEALQSGVTIKAINGELYMKHSRHDRVQLTWTEPDHFSVDVWFFSELTFQRKDGRITRFLANSSRMRNVSFERR